MYPSDSDEPSNVSGGRRPPRPRSRSAGRSGHHHSRSQQQQRRDSSSERGSSGKFVSTSELSSEGEMGGTVSKSGCSPTAQRKHVFGKHKRLVLD